MYPTFQADIFRIHFEGWNILVILKILIFQNIVMIIKLFRNERFVELSINLEREETLIFIRIGHTWTSTDESRKENVDGTFFCVRSLKMTQNYLEVA